MPDVLAVHGQRRSRRRNSVFGFPFQLHEMLLHFFVSVEARHNLLADVTDFVEADMGSQACLQRVEVLGQFACCRRNGHRDAKIFRCGAGRLSDVMLIER